MPKMTRILAAIVDTRHMTLYKEDGETVLIPQGDARLRRIVEQAGPLLQTQGYADVDLSEDPDDTSYVDFEASTNGIVKFFRVAKEKLKQLLALGLVEEQEEKPVEPTQLGVVPGSDDQEETFDPVEPAVSAPKNQTMAAVDEIIAHATPVSSENFSEEGIVKQRPIHVNGMTENSHPNNEAEDTIIAVVGGKVIPHMELIKSQITRAAKLGSTIGVERFLQRLATVIEQRSHSVEDLLKFLERGDLPIADDGSILIYKVLRGVGEGQYVDCHSKKVQQFVGAYVCMDKSLVDPNRRNECSNGLHVARRGYIRSFSGDKCVLAKLAPEDVITVPQYDANKMRVCGYHILFELSANQYNLLNQNRPITDDADGKALLAKAMRGEHIHKTHEVRITGSMGGGLITTELKKDIKPELAPDPTAATEEDALLDDHTASDAPVIPGNVENTIKGSMSRKEQAELLYAAFERGDTGAFDALMAFKKASKVGWDRLGIPDPTKPAAKPAKGKPEAIKTVAPKPKAEVIGTRKVIEAAMSEATPKQRIAKLLSIGLDKDIATRVMAIKKAAKKNWQLLGVSDMDVKRILKLTDGA